MIESAGNFHLHVYVLRHSLTSYDREKGHRFTIIKITCISLLLRTVPRMHESTKFAQQAVGRCAKQFF